MPSMSMVVHRAARAVLVVLAIAIAPSASAVTDPVSGANLALVPDPPPAGQVFDAILYRAGHPGEMGIHTPTAGSPSIHRVTTDGVEFLYDTGCGFLCPPASPGVVSSPLTLPPLPAGPHRIRIVTSFEANPTLLAEFRIVVGGGAPEVATLPIGGGVAGGLLAALVAMAAALRLRRRTRA